MDLDSPKWTTKIWTSIGNYGLHQVALPVKVHILELGHTKTQLRIVPANNTKPRKTVTPINTFDFVVKIWGSSIH